MKRKGNVFESCVCFQSLERAAYRAFRANREHGDALRFMYALECEVLELERELVSGVYQPGPYRCFTVHEPKERHIAAAPFRDRVVHHALCAALEPVFETRYIFDSYACRKNKGAHRAVARAQQFARSSRYFLKCDIRKYFDSVPHGRVKALLGRQFKDRRFLALLGCIVDHNAPNHEPGRGIPIGNLTSQYLANVYLDQLDHFVKEQLHIKRYLRYMDDFLCFSDDKSVLQEALYAMDGFLDAHLALALKQEKCYVAPVSQGLPFLGMRLYPGTIRVSRPSLVRCRRKLKRREKAFQERRITEEAMIQSVGSLIAHISHADTVTLRRQWFRKNGTVPAA